MGKEAQPYVYVKSEEHAWVPARVVKSDAKSATVAIKKYKDEEEMLVNSATTSGVSVDEVKVNLKDYPGGVLPMQNVDDGGKLGNHEDMVNLPYLHEAAILYNIKNRHMKALPYTRTGDMIVAINPYQWLTELYTEKQRNHYAHKLVWEMTESDPREHLAPHVYETSALSYKGMAFEGGCNQSILVSGESGAGKTETVKICLNHIASVQEGPKGSTELSIVVKRVLDSNPLLEAFGNAKTRRNDNSSRFGKYLQLQFDHAGERGRPVAKLVGSKSEVFLLEKNRVITHAPEERTYHIFYQILAADDATKTKIWPRLKGTNNESFKYVGSTNTTKIEGISDGDQFKRTVDVLKLIGVDDDTLNKFMQAICVCLQLGNVTFGPLGGDADKSAVTTQDDLKALAGLMGMTDANLETALTVRSLKTRDETMQVPLNPEAARGSADSLAKEIYGKIFLWVVKAINAGTSAEQEGKKQKFGLIGLLDIFGFESFDENRFEQLCINYANEKLQQKFTEDIFKAVMEEYKYEGIPLEDIKYDDNTDVLDLIESRTGMCALLNEECIRPKGTPEGFVNKALGANKKSPCLIPDKTDKSAFIIVHYAGKVLYTATNFVEANKDTLPTDLEDCATKCSNKIIADAFEYEKIMAAAAAAKSKKPKRQKSNLMAETLWDKYKTQLGKLMTSLYATQSRYIRCIKPNTVKKPLKMEHMTTVMQLRYAGIVAGVTISRSAFPNRLANSVVYARYNGMWDRDKYPSAKSGSMSIAEKVRADCEAVMTCALKDRETKDGGKVVKAFVVGKTRTYFRSGALELLESQRVTGQDDVAKTIQKFIRGWLVRVSLGINSSAKKEEEEARRRAEEERQAKLRAEKAELDKAAKNEIDALTKEAKQLKRDLEYEDEKHSRDLKDVVSRTETIEKERDDLKKRFDELAAGVSHTKLEEDRLSAKVEANMKQVTTLKKENQKIHKAYEKQKGLYDNLHKNNKIMLDALGADNSAKGELEYTQTVNKRLLESRQNNIDDHANYKEAVAKEQMKYMAFAESRLELQRTMAQILNIIGEKSHDNTLNNHCFSIGQECEANAKAIMEQLEATQGL